MGGSASQSSTTNVVNYYTEDIYIKDDADRKYVTLEEFHGSVSGTVRGVEVSADLKYKTQYTWEYAEKNGFTRIAKGSYLGFNTNSDKDIVYITIISYCGRVIAHCFPQDEGYGVIVNEHGYIRESKADDIWREKENTR